MKTNDEGINRRNIPVEFMNYIAQAFGYETFADVPEKRLSAVTEMIKIRLSQTEASIRRPYAKKYETITRRPRETALQFAVRVDNRDPYPKVTETPGTEPGDTVLHGYPFDEPLPFIPGNALAQKTGDSEKLAGDNRDRRFWPIPEQGPETITNASGKVFRLPEEEMSKAEQLARAYGKSLLPDELLIETNQQWSKEEFKRWASNQPDVQNLRKPYRGLDNGCADRKVVFVEASNDGVNWVGQQQDTETLKDHQGNRRWWPVGEYPFKIRNYSPDNWPTVAPPYFSAEGWEFEKAMKRRELKSMLTIEWLEKQQTEKHALIAQRLREVLAA